MKKIILSAALLLSAGFAAKAQAPQAFNYQGVARSLSGTPLPAGTVIGLRLTILDGSPTGTTVYQETQAPTTNNFGLYTASIGAGTPVTGTLSGVNWGTGSKYMQVEIDPAGGTSYTNAGTTQLVSVPYAVYANTATTAGSVTGTIPMSGDVTGTNSATTVTKLQGNPVGAGVPSSGQFLKWNGSAWTPTTMVVPTVSGTTNFVSKFTSPSTLGNSLVYDNGTSVAIGTTTPYYKNSLQVMNSGIDTGYRAVNGSVGTPALSSWSNPSGIYGQSGLGTGFGVTGVSDLSFGVVGGSNSASAAGVYGYSPATGGAGVYGSVAGGAGSVGGQFDGGAGGYGLVVSAGNSGFGTLTPNALLHVAGSGDAVTTVDGYTFDHQAAIIQTGTTSTANVATGAVIAANNSTLENHGVFGLASGNGASFNVGVWGAGEPSTGATGNSYGVYGYAQGGANNYGVYGHQAGTGFAGYFAGAVNVTGLLSKGGGSFKIDHPLDPENKYLYHSFVESPDMMNIYNGNITTDASGNAEVTLPDYFEALNKDFRYQLTVIGTFAQAIVSQKVSGNKFTIKTSVPNVEVSWQVTGVRQDKFANAHRIVPEVEKETENKGHYLHAAEWGMDDNKSIDKVSAPKGGDLKPSTAAPAAPKANLRQSPKYQAPASGN